MQYIHVYDKDGNEIKVVHSVKEAKGYDYKYEQKQTFALNEYSTAYVYPTYFETINHELTAVAEYLFKKCEGIRSIAFNDTSSGFISLSIEHKDCPGFYAIIEKLDFNLKNASDILKLIIGRWKNLDIKGFKDFIKDGETYGWD